MNYLITTICTKKCPYCFFPSKQKGTIEDMTLETFITCFEHQCKIGILNGDFKRRVALLGGEPTIARNFQDIVNYIKDNVFRINLFTIFSNLSGLPNIKWLVQNDFSTIDFGIVWNSTGLSSYASTLRRKVYHSLDILKANKISIRGSITVEAYQDVKDFEYLLEMKRIYGISQIRFALDTGNLPDFRTRGTTVYSILKFLQDSGFEIGIDGCGSPSFSIFNNTQINYVNHINGINIDCKGSAVVDILPDGTCIPCMPYLSFKGPKPKFTDLKSLEDLKTFYGFTPREKMLCPAIENVSRLNSLY